MEWYYSMHHWEHWEGSMEAAEAADAAIPLRTATANNSIKRHHMFNRSAFNSSMLSCSSIAFGAPHWGSCVAAL